MTSTQGNLQKGKETPKSVVGSALAAAKAKRGNGKAHPHPACSLSAQERRLLTAQIAYSYAEKRGFAPGDEWQDWFDAEAELLRLSASR